MALKWQPHQNLNQYLVSVQASRLQSTSWVLEMEMLNIFPENLGTDKLE